MTHRAFTTLFLVANLLVPAASALGGSHWRGAMHNGKFWKKSDVRETLHLTDDEVRSFDRIFARDQNKLKDLKADVEKRRDDLDALLVSDEVDQKQVLDQVDLLEQARARLGKARAMMVLEMRTVLTAEQRVKLAQLRAERLKHELEKEHRDDARKPSPSEG
jgi:Spy/CpxP family protein refolding chaperone